LPFRSIGSNYTGEDFYGKTIIAGRFDAFGYIDSSSALQGLRFEKYP
jgi:hypothetical protein